MKAKNLCVYAGLCAGLASVAAGQSQNRELQSYSGLQRVDPIRIARVAMKDGEIIMLSDWMDYNSGSTRATGVRVFDCYGDSNTDGAPDGGRACGLSNDGSRWYFGSAFCNMFTANDMTVADDTVIEDGATQASWAWFWTANGPGSSEPCVQLMFTQESVPCDENTFDYSGWSLDYGTLGYGGWYTPQADITFTLPTTGTGSYLWYWTQGQTSQGGWIIATCAQPFLWGAGEHGGSTGDRGTQGINQFDDTESFDFSHTSSECYTYDNTGGCPSVLGAMLCFYGNSGDPGDPCLEQFPNCNGDTVVNTQDFLCFLGKWSAAFSSGNYDPAADCNGDSSINTQDFLCFLGLWAGCQ